MLFVRAEYCLYRESTRERVLERAAARKKGISLSCVRKSRANKWAGCGLIDFGLLLSWIENEIILLLHDQIF